MYINNNSVNSRLELIKLTIASKKFVVVQYCPLDVRLYISQPINSCKSAILNQMVKLTAPLEASPKSILLSCLKRLKFLLLLGENSHFIRIGRILAYNNSYRPFLIWISVSWNHAKERYVKFEKNIFHSLWDIDWTARRTARHMEFKTDAQGGG